jgi:putative ABC transport system permease protein
VIQNFHYKSLHEEVEPIVLHVGKSGYGYFLARVNGAELQTTLGLLAEKWRKFEPSQSMIYSFLEDDLNNLYQREQKVKTIFTLFTGVMIAIACVGLFALSSNYILRKSKEISIKKVLGADSLRILRGVGGTFVQFVLLAFIMGCPIAYFAANAWLETFAYHVSIGVSVFLSAGLILLVVAICSIGYHTLKAANADPVKNLRRD